VAERSGKFLHYWAVLKRRVFASWNLTNNREGKKLVYSCPASWQISFV